MTLGTFKPRALKAGLGLMLTAALGLVSAPAALAGEGNPNYLGIFSSTAPTGYTPSPQLYSLAQGQNTLTFNLQVTNVTNIQQSMTLELDLDHIITYNGVNVASGQPGLVNGAVIDGQFSEIASTQVQDPNPTLFPISVGPNATQVLAFTRTFAAGACGYFQVDVAKQGLTNQKGLAGFEIRILGCGAPSISTTAAPTTGSVGDQIMDTATISGGIAPTGDISFSLFGPGDSGCGTDLVAANTAFKNIPLSGLSASSSFFTTTQAGTYNWIARYNGDINNAPVSSACGAEQVVISPVTPGINTTATPNTIIVGGLIHDVANVTGGFNPTGTVTFKLFGPGDIACTTNLVGGAGFVNVPVSGGSATSDGYTTTAVGVYRWIATYNGDTNNNPASSGCQDEQVTVSPATPRILTTATPTTAIVGALIHDSATVSGGVSPTGTVTFSLFGPSDTSCSVNLVFGAGFVNVPLSGASATSGNYATTAVGTYRWIARYNGDVNNNPVSSGCQDEQVVTQLASPSINTTPQPGTGAVGTAISDRATVSGGFNPTGTVIFKLFGPSDPTCVGASLVSGTGFTAVLLSGGSANSGNYVTTVAGTYRWIASYSGDSNNHPVTSGCNDEQVVITKPLGGQGCTPGFWKNPKHYGLWTGITPTQQVGSVFTIQATFSDGSSGSTLANATMAGGLAFQGGSDLNGAAQILLRAAIAGLLDANNPNVSYSMTAAQIVNSVNGALASNDRNTIINLATQIDNANNGRAGCPLS